LGGRKLKIGPIRLRDKKTANKYFTLLYFTLLTYSMMQDIL